MRNVNVGFQTLKPSTHVIDYNYVMIVIILLMGHINLHFSLSGEIALYAFLICVSQSPSPVKFLQAADGKAPDELCNLSAEIPKAKHQLSGYPYMQTSRGGETLPRPSSGRNINRLQLPSSSAFQGNALTMFRQE